MIAHALGLGAALLVVSAAVILHRRSESVCGLKPTRTGDIPVFTRLGSYARNMLRRVGVRIASRHDRISGVVALLAPIALLISPFVACVVIAVGPAVAVGLDLRERSRRDRELEHSSFLVIRLLVVALGNGCNVRRAIDVVGRHCSGSWAVELRVTSRRIDNGESVLDALRFLRERVPGSVRPFVSTLIAGERYGAPLSEVLDRLAEQCRAEQRRHVERSARRLSVHLLFPLAACTLPAFALLALVPIIASALAALA